MYAVACRVSLRVSNDAARHSSEQFVTFLEDIVASRPWHRHIHVICDNVSSHKTEVVEAFLSKHRRAQITTRQPTRRGSTKWRTGSHASNAT